jgi:phosphohistidine phosphatase SixA
MKKLLGIIVLGLMLTTSISHAKSKQELHNDGVKALQEGGKIIYLRHAYAPRTVENGNNDKKYKVNKCSTQRDILTEGIKQSKLIGKFVKENNINIEKIIVSPTCRTYKTAKYAGWEYTINKNLQNTSKKKLQEKRFKKINKIVSAWKDNGNLVLVTHFYIINPTFPGVKADSGEMIIVNSDMVVLGRIRFPYDITIKD